MTVTPANDDIGTCKQKHAMTDDATHLRNIVHINSLIRNKSDGDGSVKQ
ncbi:hypothetical protein Pvag_pPag20190 (plasmid) [Pantoea vagans C9-1]|nr:hypothetical protein Pvag_pPag20190 [Pantoea vagans C9-1]